MKLIFATSGRYVEASDVLQNSSYSINLWYYPVKRIFQAVLIGAHDLLLPQDTRLFRATSDYCLQ